MREMRVVVAVFEAVAGDLRRPRVHDDARACAGMGWIMHRACQATTLEIFLHENFAFLSGLGGGAGGVDFAEVAGGIDVVAVFAFRVDEIAEGVFLHLAHAELRLRAEDGGLAEHVVLAGADGCVDDLADPVERLVVVGDADDRHGGIDVLSGLHGLDGLSRVEPRLGDDDDGVQIRLAHVLYGIVAVFRIEFVGHERAVRPFLDALRFAVAECDAVNERM